MQKALEKLSAWMILMNTDDQLATQIMLVTTAWIAQEEIHIERFLPPIRQQMEIGWSHFIVGRIHKSFQQESMKLH